MIKNHMEIINKDDDWNHMTSANMVEEPIEKGYREKMEISINRGKTT